LKATDNKDDYGEEGDRDLPDHDRVVGLRQVAHTQEVYDGEYSHECHGHDDADPR
jgi:hypothetical protein